MSYTYSAVHRVYCDTLQHTATHCNTLQHTATHCNTLQRARGTIYIFVIYVFCSPSCVLCAGVTLVSVYWMMRNALYLVQAMCHTVTHKRRLQQAATHYDTLQHTATHCNTLEVLCLCDIRHCTTHYIRSHHTATHCNTLQHTATHCNTLQHTATR